MVAALDWGRVVSSGVADSQQSAIAEFDEKHRRLTMLASFVMPGGALREDLASVLADQILLGYVGISELYFRRILSSLAELCAETRARVATKKISFGSIDHYSPGRLTLALSEDSSYSDGESVKSLLKKDIGLSEDSIRGLQDRLADFSVVCQLRHAIVHSGGFVNFRVAQQIGAVRVPRDAVITLGFAELEMAAAACLSLVRSVNQEVARELVWRDTLAGRIVGDRRKDRARVKKYFEHFGDEGGTSTEDELHKCIRVCVQRM
ncbi:MAG: hypothetical protein IPL94_02395 [Tetrasphaera sp.]|nr:hypothetical protein [Tetrasphaera sp.]